MNKRVLTLSVILIAILLIFRYCNSNNNDQKAPEAKPAPLSISENSRSFNQSFTELLDTYYALKDAFISGDISKIDPLAAKLAKDANSLRISEIQGDSSGTIKETATYFTGTISGSAKAISGNKDLLSKQKELNSITDAMWNLTRTVHYDGQKVYCQFCAAAFDNTGAYWLSDKPKDGSPYSAKNAAPCGEVTDSLDYRKK